MNRICLILIHITKKESLELDYLIKLELLFVEQVN